VTAEPKRKPDEQPYRVVSITYLGDDAAAARAIREFLRLRRLAQTEREAELKIEEPDRG